MMLARRWFERENSEEEEDRVGQFCEVLKPHKTGSEDLSIYMFGSDKKNPIDKV